MLYLVHAPPDVIAFADDMIRQRRHADPAGVANGVLYLSSSMGGLVTGTTLSVDGGMRGWRNRGVPHDTRGLSSFGRRTGSQRNPNTQTLKEA
ncbi:MAG TPA: SDR family oxidoreductase [Pararobbsia sp.]|nr:SDR family oxidoreductase [Pararobbsia sp.]